MPTLGLGRESDRHVSLLGDTDHRHRSRNAGDQSIGERAAFVQHEHGLDGGGPPPPRLNPLAAPPVPAPRLPQLGHPAPGPPAPPPLADSSQPPAPTARPPRLP